MGQKAFYVLALSHFCCSELCSNKILMAKYGKLCDEKKVKNDLGAFEDKMFLINSVLVCRKGFQFLLESAFRNLNRSIVADQLDIINHTRKKTLESLSDKSSKVFDDPKNQAEGALVLHKLHPHNQETSDKVKLKLQMYDKTSGDSKRTYPIDYRI